MATNFPTGVDNFPTHTDNNNEKIAASHLNNVQDGLKATQQKVLDIGTSNIVLTATGTANAVTITTGGSFALTQGNKLSFKAIADNTTNVTINVDGTGVKPLLKLDGSQISASGLKNGKVYDVYYDTTSGGRFFLLARATGDAVAANVLAGKGFSNETDSGLTGTMPNRTGDNASIGSSISGTTLKLIAPNGFFDGVDDTVTITDPGFIASNIRNNVNLLGQVGTLIEGKRWASGNATLIAFDSYTRKVTVNGLSFLPTTIVIYNDRDFLVYKEGNAWANIGTNTLAVSMSTGISGSPYGTPTDDPTNFYVNATGFSLRLAHTGSMTTANWIAFE